MKLNTCHIDSYHEPQVIEMPYKYLISFQARKVTRQLIRTVDCTASTIINLMVPGNRTTIIKVGDNVMVLKRGLDYVNGRQTFNLPPFTVTKMPHHYRYRSLHWEVISAIQRGTLDWE